MKANNYQLEKLNKEIFAMDLIGNNDSYYSTLMPLLFQSGYMTIKDYDSRFDMFKMGFPNKEIEEGFTNILITTSASHPAGS